MRMIHVNPAKRITLAAIAAHPWIEAALKADAAHPWVDPRADQPGGGGGGDGGGTPKAGFPSLASLNVGGDKTGAAATFNKVSVFAKISKFFSGTSRAWHSPHVARRSARHRLTFVA